MHPATIPPELTEKQLEILVRRLADDLKYGEDASRYIGSGVDYAQSRHYMPGDPVKSIDWRITARTGKFHVKEYEAVKSMPVYLVVDTSASMTVSSIPTTKHALATIIAGALGLAAIGRQSPVGILGAGERKLHYPPSMMRQRVFQWLADLYFSSPDERTFIADRLDQINGWQKTRCMILILSDLHELEALGGIKRAAQQHDVAVIQLQDPAERGRIRSGFFRGAEAESGRAFVAHGKSRWFDNEGHLAGQLLKQSGVDHLLLGTDQPFVAELRWFLISRGGLMRQTR